MIVTFIIGAMLFFGYVWARIISSSNTTGFEKFYGTVAVGMLEFYYLMQLFEHL